MMTQRSPLWSSALFALCAATVALTVVTPGRAEARDCGVGQTVFMDTIYGMGAGMLVGGLWMIANMNDTKGKEVLPTLATGGLIGGGVGAVIGIVEVGLCTTGKSGGDALQPGLQPPKLWVHGDGSPAQKKSISLPMTGLEFSYRM